METDVHKVTKKEVLENIAAWRLDDGTWNDEDIAVYLAYNDGSFVDAKDLNGKNFKKAGIIGAYISTPNDEMAWGGEINRHGEFVPWTVHVMDDYGNELEGVSNSYSGYKTTGIYYERMKVTFNTPNGRGGYKTVRQVMRRSTVKPV